jgi:hypothetical protein
MNGIDLDYTEFECRKIRKRVIITSIVSPVGHSKPAEADIHSTIEAIDCNHKAVCGVLIEQGERRHTYNWQLCVHPELFGKKTEKAE